MAGTERMRFTDRTIARLGPCELEYTVWDSHIVGLGVRVRPTCGKTLRPCRTLDAAFELL